MKAPVEAVNDGNFAEIVLRSNRLVLVDFWRNRARHARALAPTGD